VLAERFITKDGEKPAVGDAAKGLRAFTSESKNVSITGVDLFLCPHPRNCFQTNPRPPDHRTRANAKTTCKQRQADVFVKRLLTETELMKLLHDSVFRSLWIAKCDSPLIEAFSDKRKRTKVGNRFQLVYFCCSPIKFFLAFPVETVLTNTRTGEAC
jgi:hypothetical protein